VIDAGPLPVTVLTFADDEDGPCAHFLGDEIDLRLTGVTHFSVIMPTLPKEWDVGY
jgi:hypothetical protein